ncbi:hypothetical protein M3Y97_00195500 [Aphelenchoides bicaudatus]|nr:hypothetical protein M3Y97_00195500 [Aphelenchoides bicaudatus]
MKKLSLILLTLLINAISLVECEQKSPICDKTNITGSCTHYEFYSLYRSPRCCDYEPNVCCYQIPDAILITLFTGSGLALLLLVGWAISCCLWCCCSPKKSQST